MAIVERRFDRKATKLNGHISGEDIDKECQIVDLSSGGDKIMIKPALEVGQTVHLKIGAIGPYPAEVVWARSPHTGLKFSEPPEVMAEVLMAVALYG